MTGLNIGDWRGSDIGRPQDGTATGLSIEPAGVGLRITELAASLGTTVRALRYYEQVGLIEPGRTTGNARVYGPEARRRAGLIVALRQAGVGMAAVIDITTQRPGLSSRRLAAGALRSRLQVLEAQRLRAVAVLESLSGADLD